MQTEQKSQFRLNPQALVVVGIALIALALPVAGVLAFVWGGKQKHSAPTGPDPQLVRVLEEVSDKTLAPKPLETGNREAIRINSPEPSERAAAAVRLAASVGGTAMPVTEAPNQVRVWVSLPEKRVPAFVEAFREGVKELEYPPEDPGGTRILVELIIERKSP